MARLYDRIATLTMIFDFIKYEISDLRFSFSIEKTPTSEADKGEIFVYNLSSATRQYLDMAKQQLDAEGKWTDVRLMAGYQNLYGLLFSGNIKNVVHARSGGDLVSKIEVADGVEAMRLTRSALSYPQGTTLTQMIGDVVRDFKVNGLNIGEIATTKLSEILQKDMSLSGFTKDIMDKIAAKFNLSWVVQDGAVQVLDKGAASVGEVIVLNSSTGLVGIPERTWTGCKFKSLLNSKLKPNSLVQIASEFLSGIFRVESCRYVGDTHDASWHVDAEAMAYQNLDFYQL